MNPSKHLVKVVDCGMSPDKEDNPQPFIQFKGADDEFYIWRGSRKSDKSRDYAVKALMTVGFTGTDWAEFNGVGCLDGREVMITVENETYNGKTRAKVKWINPIHEVMSPDEVRAKVSDKALFAKHGAKSAKTDPGF
jgi:hypothetical protein